jgi:hypothetical protein
MTNFIRTEREDGTIEYISSNYDELMALEEVDPNQEPVIITDEEIAEASLSGLRRLRDEKLSETDWWMMPDRTATDEQRAYRQSLRDITDTYTSIEEVVWPEKPE